MSESATGETPRTELAKFAYKGCALVHGEPLIYDNEAVTAEFARALERENADLRQALAEAKDGWLADLQRIASAMESDTYNAEHLIHLAEAHRATMRSTTRQLAEARRDGERLRAALADLRRKADASGRALRDAGGGIGAMVAEHYASFVVALDAAMQTEVKPGERSS